MKVALVSSYCLDSTMPLAVHLAAEKIDVHLFGIMPKYNRNLCVVDFSKLRHSSGFINSAVSIKELGISLHKYLSGITTKFFVYPGGAGKKTFLPDIFYAWKFSRFLIKQNFDAIHLIHTSNRFSILIMYFLKKENIVQTLHEVTAHTGNTSNFNIKILKNIIKNNIPVIFNSQTSKDRFLIFRESVTKSNFDNSLYSMIRFSLYETYQHFTPTNTTDNTAINNSIPIILHFGRILPYKGIDILVEAVKIVQKNQAVHLIIAGGGDAYFNFEGIDSYQFINYTITNEEIIDLVKKCSMVVCPYRSVSQSGIPMTVYPFNKPIIASNIGGFSEVIDNNITGILVDKIDAPSFATAIQSLIESKALTKKMETNIDHKFKNGEFAWSHIAKQTVQFYKYHLKRK